MEMRVDKSRGYKMTGCVDDLAGLRRNASLDGHDTPCRDADIDAAAATAEGSVFDYKIHREALNLTEDSWADYIRGSAKISAMRESCN
jgi:hypothetical protein